MYPGVIGFEDLLHQQPTPLPVKSWCQWAVSVGREEAKQQAYELELLQAPRQLLVLRHQLPVVLEQGLQAGTPRLEKTKACAESTQIRNSVGKQGWLQGKAQRPAGLAGGMSLHQW